MHTTMYFVSLNPNEKIKYQIAIFGLQKKIKNNNNNNTPAGRDAIFKTYLYYYVRVCGAV